MGFSCGIVGLPNVGKSTLFNALTSTQAAEAANYPFCTIEPNVGKVAVADPRLERLAELGKSAKVVPTQLAFVDIAGLVRGASKGEGLGNQFLANIREVDAIAHVLRCFGGEVTHVEGSIDPLRDAETVETELMLADLDSLERRLDATAKKAKGGDKEAKALLAVVEAALAELRAGRAARRAVITDEQQPLFRQLQLLTAKPVLYVCNVEEAAAAAGNSWSAKIGRCSLLIAASRAGRPTRRMSSAFCTTGASTAASLSPPFARFSRLGRRFSRPSRSASISSVSTISASRTGSTEPETCVTSASSMQRSTWAMASTSRILARNWLPSPSPLLAPFTSPAMSTNSSWVATTLAELAIAASLWSRGSGTATRPTLGSMVQNG